MKILVIGAGGGVGKEIVSEALKAGHQVTAGYRSPPEVAPKPGLRIQVGSVLDPDFLVGAVGGCDAVVSAIGTAQFQKPLTLYSDGMRFLEQAMKKAGVTRLIVLSAGGATVEAGDPWLFRFVLKPILNRVFRHLYDDIRRMERFLEATSLNWTIIRLPYLTNQPPTGVYVSSRETTIGSRRSIGRADAAHYIVANLQEARDFRHHVCIAN